MADLRPCPFCGNAEPVLGEIKLDDADGLGASWCWFVWCEGCEAETGVGLNPEEARERWNRRAGDHL